MGVLIKSPAIVASAIVAGVLLAACASQRPSVTTLRTETQSSGGQASLRGVFAVDDRVVWASGSGGTVLRTTNAGTTWERIVVEGADDCDFRDVQAFDAERALLLVAGTPARIYRTQDGGKSWSVVHADERKGAFFDAFAFWDAKRGVAFGDPIDGVFTILRTTDGGASWQQVAADRLPAPLEDEAAFAASGTCVAVAGKELAFVATTRGRVLRSEDGGATWRAHMTPLDAREASSGAFSMLMLDEERGVVVGGDYAKPERVAINAAFTRDGGKSWTASVVPPSAYRSAVVRMSGGVLLAVGRSGACDFSYDGGRCWESLSATGFYAIAASPSGSSAWAVGAKGRIARFSLE